MLSEKNLVTHHGVMSNGVRLNVLEVQAQGLDTKSTKASPESTPTLVMLHGLRDSAWSLMPIAEAFSQSNVRVVLPELRGHGASEHSDAYSINDYILDLHEVITALTQGPVIIFEHSLGGHIVSKFAALFPELTKAIVLVEGLGPPKRSGENDIEQQMQSLRFMLLNRLKKKDRPSRPLKSKEEAAAKLLHNNPRMQAQEATRIASHLVKEAGHELHWVFDSRANSVFVGVNLQTNTNFWRQIKAPVCVVSGRLSYEYWHKEMASADFDGHFADQELEERASAFAIHEHHWLEQSGHMAHYDEPEALTQICKNFIFNGVNL
jgi:pimeloyl-ACP methyl ester carboxylesterase|tara:strand:- start:134 stop:1096 length:963 start_codon:yes stop_codon:yes gene_type:complete